MAPPNPHLLAVGTRVSQNLSQAPKEELVSMLRANGHNAIQRNIRHGFIYMICKDCDATCSVSTYRNDAWCVTTRHDAVGRQCQKSADALTKKSQKGDAGKTPGRQREKSADAPIKKSQKQDAISCIALLADAAAAAAAATNAVQMLTPAISYIAFPGAELLASDVAVYVRKQFSTEEKTQRNHLVANCQSFPADLKCRLSFLMMNMIRALNQHATDPHIEQFQMGFCKSGCNILKQRCVMWCWWRCTDACGGVCILYVVVVYGCMWWCTDACGGVRMHVVILTVLIGRTRIRLLDTCNLLLPVLI